MNKIGFIAAGTVILLINIKVSLMSHDFVFGYGHDKRPILEFMVYVFLMFGVYFVAVELARRIVQLKGSNRFNLTWIFVIAILCRLIYLPSQLIQETDPYRYIWDGQAVLHGANPYLYPPQKAFELSNSYPFLRSDRAQDTFIKINHPDVKTIYPPLSQYLFAGSQIFTPWSLTGWKIMIFIAECAIMVLMIAALHRLNIRKEWFLIYGWSPLIIKEYSNSLHLDVFAVLLLCSMIYCLIRGWTFSSYLALALATLIKLFSIILLPLLIVLTIRNKRRWNLVLFIVIIIIFYLPFMDAGMSLFEGLSAFSSSWKVNDSLFSLVQISLQALISSRDQVNLISRIIIGILFIALSFFVVRWFIKRKDISSFCKAGLILTAGLFFLAPTGNPWYFTWIFPFLILLPVRSLILFSGLVFLYYLDFYFMYHFQEHLFTKVRLIEYGIFFVMLGWELWRKNRQSLLLSLSLMKKSLLKVR